MYRQFFFSRTVLALYAAVVLCFSAGAQEALSLVPEDLIIDQSLEGGYDLFIRAREGIGSVLLTDSTSDPEKRVSTYALRNPEYHPVNGDEPRLLNGEFLPAKEKGLYSIIDSSPEPHPVLGTAFHFFIPYVVEYGYSWSREGKIQILNGTWLNIRAFAERYASYEGPFMDNPFVIQVVQRPSEPGQPESYMEDTVEAYKEISAENDGDVIFGKGEEDIINNVRDILNKAGSKSIDLVLCLDTTKSMEDDIPHLRSSLVPMLKEEVSGFDAFRIGLLLYRDYFETYLAYPYPFEQDFGKIQAILNRIRVFGGRDIPEAVYEALYAGINSYEWKAEKKMIILVGDAPPHPLPRGAVTKEMVYSEAQARNIEIHTIILPH